MYDFLPRFFTLARWQQHLWLLTINIIIILLISYLWLLPIWQDRQHIKLAIYHAQQQQINLEQQIKQFLPYQQLLEQIGIVRQQNQIQDIKLNKAEIILMNYLIESKSELFLLQRLHEETNNFAWQLEIKGSYEQLRSFISQVNQSIYLFVIDQLEFNKNLTTDNISLTLTIFLLVNKHE